jgi:oxygen-independent coproporphyrinogen-3 oxidase
MIDKKPIGIYIHFPFCKNICSYCDFVVDKNLELIDTYIKSLLLDIENTTNNYYDYNHYVKTIYIGGGTPSLLSVEQMEIILNKLNQKFDLSKVVEISMESNPASLSVDKMKGYKNLGINRLSIGVQSFNKKELGLLKRNHSPNLAKKSIIEAKEVGFNSVNFDLIFSVPNQTVSDWLYNLEESINLSPDHISCYSLTYEEGTPLHKKLILGKINNKNEDEDATTYLKTIDLLTKNGFTQYEVSNFAKKGQECQHNLGVWRNQEYMGFGVGAHWYINNYRYENTRELNKYISAIRENADVPKTQRLLSNKDKEEEYILLGLRAEGIDLNKINNLTLDFDKVLNNNIIKRMLVEKMIEIKNLNIKLTYKGYLIADTITYQLLKILIN